MSAVCAWKLAYDHLAPGDEERINWRACLGQDGDDADDDNDRDAHPGRPTPTTIKLDASEMSGW